MITEILLLILSSLVVLLGYLRYNADYFKRNNIPYINANLIFGNLKDLILARSDPCALVSEWYNHPNAKDQPFVGIYVFQKPGLIIRDPELIKQILITDFSKFSNRYASLDPKDTMGVNGLFFGKNPNWRIIRNKMTPAFSSVKMKQMYPTVEIVTRNLETFINNIPPTDNNRDIRHITSLFATDLIASLAFGLEVNSFDDPNNEFLRNGHQNFALNFVKAAQLTSVFFLPKLVPWVKSRGFDEPVENFFRRIFDYVFEERQKTGVFRNDLIDILISLNKTSEGGVEFTGDVLRAQSAVFYGAGFHTISNTIAFALYELAKQPESQAKLRTEIKNVLSKSEDSTYKSITSMEYLNMTMQETLRLYPTLAFLDREATLEDGEEYSLEPFGSFKIPNGMPVYVPQAAIYRDPKYFPEPNKFVPERFSSENRDNIISGSYMPFGIGPHKCIGERIGALLVKLGIFHLLKDHAVCTNDRTPNYMEFDKQSFFINPKGPIFLDIVRADKL